MMSKMLTTCVKPSNYEGKKNDLEISVCLNPVVSSFV